MTNHPPTTTPVTLTNFVGTPLIIALTNLSAAWNDVDGDPLSLAAVSLSTNGISLTNTGSALIYFNSNNVADQWVCTISDGSGGTNLQTVSIVPVLPPNPMPLITGLTTGNGGITLSLAGAPGYTYILATTTNLTAPGAWQFIATNTMDTNGVWQFLDPQITNTPQRYYRLYLAP